MRREETSIESGDIEWDSFSKGEEHRLTALQNEIFTGSWGFCSNTDDEIKYYLELTGVELEDVILLKEGTCDVGYCWAHESLSSSDTTKIARIHMIGVKKQLRGKGLGKELLRLSCRLLRNRGFRRIELTVDSDNKPACGLYAAFGFKLKSSSLWFEKNVNRQLFKK